MKRVKRLVAGLRPIWRNGKLIYLRWALREIDPLHPDVPGIVLDIHRLESEGQAA